MLNKSMVSINVVLEDESILEINNLLNSKEFYISPDGKIVHSMSNDILNLVLLHMTT